jgi:hypothetical protein
MWTHFSYQTYTTGRPCVLGELFLNIDATVAL